MQNLNDWTINKNTGTARHKSGLIVAIRNSDVENIESMPPSIRTRDLPRLMDEALRAYNTMTKPVEQAVYPKKPILSIKRKAAQ